MEQQSIEIRIDDILEALQLSGIVHFSETTDSYIGWDVTENELHLRHIVLKIGGIKTTLDGHLYEVASSLAEKRIGFDDFSKWSLPKILSFIEACGEPLPA